MSDSTDDIIARLIAEDDEFKKIYQAHREYDQKIKKLDKKVGLTPHEETERKKLQKLKLSEKDRMEGLIAHYKGIEGSAGEERQS